MELGIGSVRGSEGEEIGRGQGVGREGGGEVRLKSLISSEYYLENPTNPPASG